MVKKFYFLCGLPRAGNTLLSSIINQNPDVAITANSPVGDMLRFISIFISIEKNNDVVTGFPDTVSHNNVCKNIIPNYYKDWKQTHIIDRHAWGRLEMFNILKKNNSDIKMIILVRDVAEVLASLIKIGKTTNNNFINTNNDTLDKQCDYLMRDGGMIDLELASIHNMIKKENRHMAHFLEYNDLVKNPEKEINAIYDFLDIPKFKHKYTNLEQFQVNGIKYDDSVFGVDLHTIRTNSIKKADYNVEDILPKRIIEKCKALNIWHKQMMLI